MLNKRTDKRLQNSNQSFEESQMISDAQFVEDLQILLNRESMLKADLADALCVTMVDLERSLVIVRPSNGRLSMPNRVRQRARDLRLKADWGYTWWLFNKCYQINTDNQFTNDESYD